MSARARLAASPLAVAVAAIIGHFLVDFYVAMLPPLLPLLARTFGLSLTAMGVAATAQTLGAALSQPLFGWLADRGPRGWMMPLSMVWVGVILCSLGFASTFVRLVAICVIGALGSAAYHPVGASTVGESMRSHRALGVSIYVGVGTAGLALAPVVVVPVAQALGLRGILWLSLAGVAVAAAQALTLRSRPSAAAPPQTLAPIAPISDDHPPTPPAGTGSQCGSESRHHLGDERPTRSRVRVWLVALLTVVSLRIWVMRAFGVFLPVYCTDLGYSDFAAAQVLSLYLLATAVGAGIAGYLADVYGRRPVIMVSGILAIPFLGLFLAGGSLALLWLTLGAVAVYAATPVIIAWAQELSPGRTATASGLMVGVSFGCGGVSGAVAGALADAYSLPIALTINLALLTLPVVLTLFLPARAERFWEERERRVSG